MRLLLIDIDTLRPDHLGCYGYDRATSPNIDRLASDATVFENCFVSDSPCKPARTAFGTGLYGTRNGVVAHLNEAANLQVQANGVALAHRLYEHGVSTNTISSFADRHQAWWFLSGFEHAHTFTLKRGMETADEVNDAAIPWIRERAAQDDWLLHVHYWDPHTPYRSPKDWADRFLDDGLQLPFDEDEFEGHQQIGAPHSASFLHFTDVDQFDNDELRIDLRLDDGSIGHEYGSPILGKGRLEDYDDAKLWMAGYDGGIAYADHHVGLLLEELELAGVLDDTVIVIMSDHGDHQGELGVYGEHNSVFDPTQRIPLIIRAPGVLPAERRDDMVMHLDLVPTIAELFDVPGNPAWDGRSLFDLFRDSPDWRDHVVLTHGMWTAQRGVRTKDWSFVRTYHPGYFLQFDETSLFDVTNDPFLRDNQASARPDVVGEMSWRLDRWHAGVMQRRPGAPVDPLQYVLRRGPYLTDPRAWQATLRDHGFDGEADELGRWLEGA